MQTDKAQFERLAATFSTERMKFKLLFALSALAAFYTVPLAVLGLIAMVAGGATGGVNLSQLTIGEVFRFVALVAFAGSALGSAIVFRKKENEARARDVFDAERRRVQLAQSGDANARAARIAGFVDGAGGALALSKERSAPPSSSGMTIARAASRLRCTWCGRHVSVAQGDETTGDATCAECGHRFSMRDQLQAGVGMRAKPHALDASVVGDVCTIVHPTATIFGWMPTVVLGVLIVLVVPESLTHPRPEHKVIFAVLGAAFVASAFFTSKMRARTTVYTISASALVVAVHGLFGGELGTWQVGDVDQVFVRHRKRTKTVRERSGGRERKRRVQVTTYDVVLLDVGGREKVLSRDLERADVALYVEQEIENRFGIVDRPMKEGPSR